MVSKIDSSVLLRLLNFNEKQDNPNPISIDATSYFNFTKIISVKETGLTTVWDAKKEPRWQWKTEQDESIATDPDVNDDDPNQLKPKQIRTFFWKMQ